VLEITTVLPSSMAVFESTTINVKGDFHISAFSSPVVACRWNDLSTVDSTPALSFNDTLVSCEGLSRSSAATLDLSVSVNNGTKAWSDERPFSYYRTSFS
jgi:hypothetical protein